MLVVAVGGVLTLTSCTEKVEPSDASGAIAVDSSGFRVQCLAKREAPSGNLVFNVTNSGNEVTEFYLLGEDGLRIIGEVENIGPGLSRDLVVQAGPGSYFTACKPGMVGDGIRGAFRGHAIPVSSSRLLDRSASSWIRQPPLTAPTCATKRRSSSSRRKRLRRRTRVADFDEARAQYAKLECPGSASNRSRSRSATSTHASTCARRTLSRARSGPAGTRLRRTSGRRTDYSAFSEKERNELAALLVADTAELNKRVQDLEFTPDQLGNGAKELLDEVATGKVTGEEEFWSHTDLWDFQANLDGARIAYEELRGVVKQKDPELAKTLDEQFADVQEMLNQYRERTAMTATMGPTSCTTTS